MWEYFVQIVFFQKQRIVGNCWVSRCLRTGDQKSIGFLGDPASHHGETSNGVILSGDPGAADALKWHGGADHGPVQKPGVECTCQEAAGRSPQQFFQIAGPGDQCHGHGRQRRQPQPQRIQGELGRASGRSCGDDQLGSGQVQCALAEARRDALQLCANCCRLISGVQLVKSGDMDRLPLVLFGCRQFLIDGRKTDTGRGLATATSCSTYFTTWSPTLASLQLLDQPLGSTWAHGNPTSDIKFLVALTAPYIWSWFHRLVACTTELSSFAESQSFGLVHTLGLRWRFQRPIYRAVSWRLWLKILAPQIWYKCLFCWTFLSFR